MKLKYWILYESLKVLKDFWVIVQLSGLPTGIGKNTVPVMVCNLCDQAICTKAINQPC